jgi:hypothetical protein
MSWRNWGDHPIIVAVSVTASLAALAYTIYDHSRSSTQPTPSAEVSPTVSPSTHIPNSSQLPLTPISPSPISTPTPVPSQSNATSKLPSPDTSNQSPGIPLIRWSDSVNNLSLRQSIGLIFTFRCPLSTIPVNESVSD